jgi:uncharacterized membrane protein YphA (DoxX/SURF4 family)
MVIVLALVRTLVGLVFVASGIAKLVQPAPFAANFAHWGLPMPGVFSLTIGAIETVCGALFALGALTRPVGLLLATIMVGAIMTAGRVDGGPHLIVPPLLFAATVFFAWRAGRFGGSVPRRPPGVQ